MPVTLGERVRAARIVKDWTARELSAQIELTPDYISHIELGHKTPSLKVMRALAAKLGVSIDWLLGN